MEFRKKLKSRFYTAVIYVIFGICVLIATFLFDSDNDFTSSFAFAMIIIGVVRIRNYFLITKNEDTIKKQQIIETDERNILIRYKAKSAAFSVYILLSSIAVCVLSFLNMHEIEKWIALSAFFLIFIYWIFYWIYQKKS